MAEYNFLQRKKDVLGKIDKSHAGKWDEEIVDLCEKINLSDSFYTTSSCSGRVLLMIDQDKKSSGLFLWISHKKVSLENFKRELQKIKKKNLVKFKSEPPLLHIVCKTLEDAKNILEKAVKAGWKKSGIINLGKNIVLELHSTEKLEFPILKNGKSLVNEEFLKSVLEKSNQKLEKGWKKISDLEKAI